jgi:hypothetical protein
MKRSLTLGAAVLALAFVAAAQETPRFGAFLGYTFVHFSPDTSVPSTAVPPSILPTTFNANGGGVQFEWNYNKWIGLVVDGDAVHHGDIGEFARGTAVDFMAGPRVSYRKSRFRLFGEALFGGVYYNSSTMVPLLTPGTVTNNGVAPITPDTVVTTRANRGQTNFAFMTGGGVDLKLNKHFSFRPIEADYFMTRINNMQNVFDRHQNNFRYSAGVDYTFGAR